MAKEEPTEEEQEEQEEPQESTLREDLENAIEEHENAEEGEAEDETEGEAPESAGEKEPGEERPDDGKIGDPEGEAEPAGVNAPLGFSVEAREAWKDVPDLVKEQVHKREQEITEAMANTGEYRRTHTALTDLAQSYAPILAAEGAETPMAAVEGLFRTVAELRVGTPQQTAQKMADLIGHYGIDIPMLDSALSGKPMATPEETRLSQLMDQKLAPFQEMMNNQQNTTAANHQANANAVNAELAEFAAKPESEFLNDVREDMADLIELASKRGQILSFEDAYRKACSLHPEISKVVDKRAADAALIAGKHKANGKAAAGSALPAAGAAVVSGGPQDNSVRGAIEAAWDAATE